MAQTAFSLDDLLDLLSAKAGLPPQDRTSDTSATLESIGLDSLAFLALQTELKDRYGVELPEERPFTRYTLGEMIGDINDLLDSGTPVAPVSRSGTS